MKHESFFALVAGLAAGVAVGVLFAPDKGSETRRKLKEATQEGCEIAKVKGEELKEEMSRLRDTLAKEGEHLKDEAGRESFSSLKSLRRLSQSKVKLTTRHLRHNGQRIHQTC